MQIVHAIVPSSQEVPGGRRRFAMIRIKEWPVGEIIFPDGGAVSPIKDD